MSPLLHDKRRMAQGIDRGRQKFMMLLEVTRPSVPYNNHVGIPNTLTVTLRFWKQAVRRLRSHSWQFKGNFDKIRWREKSSASPATHLPRVITANETIDCGDNIVTEQFLGPFRERGIHAGDEKEFPPPKICHRAVISRLKSVRNTA